MLHSCLTLCDPTYSSSPGSFVHVDSPGKNIGVVAILSSRESSQLRDPTPASYLLQRQACSLLQASPGIMFVLGCIISQMLTDLKMF